MAPERSTIYSTPEVFNSIARRISRESEAPIMLLGIGGRGKRFLNYFSSALYGCEVPHVAYLLRQDGNEEGYRKIVGAVPYDTVYVSRGSIRPGTAIIVDDIIDTFEQGSWANFFALENRGELGYTKDLLTVVHYDLMGVAHFSLDTNDKKRVVIGNRDLLIARLREVGPRKFAELQDTGSIRHIGQVDPLLEIHRTDDPEPLLSAYFREKMGGTLGLRILKASGRPQRRPVTTDEELIEQIASGD